jgi:hypothetical protein
VSTDVLDTILQRLERIDIPSCSWTWDELSDIPARLFPTAQRFHGEDPDDLASGIPYDRATWLENIRRWGPPTDEELGQYFAYVLAHVLVARDNNWASFQTQRANAANALDARRRDDLILPVVGRLVAEGRGNKEIPALVKKELEGRIKFEEEPSERTAARWVERACAAGFCRPRRTRR